jgi:hypothetical protein
MKMGILLKAIYKFNAMSLKILKPLNRKINPKICMEK